MTWSLNSNNNSPWGNKPRNNGSNNNNSFEIFSEMKPTILSLVYILGNFFKSIEPSLTKSLVNFFFLKSIKPDSKAQLCSIEYLLVNL